MSDPIPEQPVDDPVDDTPAVEPVDEPPPPPTFAELLALLGLPEDARSVVITPESTVAIAADYPEPYTPPTEES